MKSFSSFKLEEAKATYTIKDSEGNIKHAGTDKDMAYKTHKSLNAKEAGHKLYKNGVATLSEAPIQPNGTDKIIPDEGMCEGLCQVCGATDCKEHFYKSPAVTGYVKEEAEHTVHVDDGSKYDEEPHPKDAEHVMSGVKKHGGKFAGHSDKGAYFKFGSRTDAKNFVDHVKKSPHRSVSADLHESRGHKIIATALANAERMKTVQIPTPAERRAQLEKQNKEKEMKESADKKPYIVISHVSDNTGTRAGGEKVEKSRVATKLIATSPEHAIQLSKAHHEKSGRKVYSAAIKEQAPVAATLNRHTVVVHVSDPREPNEPKQRKALSVLAVHAKSAETSARKHFEKKGWKVHSSAIKEDISVDEAIDTVKRDEKGKVLAWSHEGDWEKKSTKNKQGAGKAANLAGRALQKTKSLNKEEVDLEEGLFDNMPNTKAGFAYKDKKRSERQAEHEKQDPKMAVHYAKNMVDTAKAAKKAKERGITKHADDFGWQVRNGVQRGKLPEEVELDESAHVYDTKTGKVHSTHDTYKKAVNAMNKLNDKHQGYDTPGGLVQDKFGTKRVNEDLDESAWGNDKSASLRQAHDRHMEKALAANKAGDDQAVKTHQRKMQMIQGKLQKLKNNEEVELGEECEILSELSKSTMRSYLEKGITKGIQDTFAGKGDISKKREDGLNKAMKKVYGEEVEELDELSKTALGNYAKAAAFDIANKGSAVGKAGNNLAVLANPKGPLTQLNKRLQGHAKAVQKLTKEEVEEFMQTEAYDQLDEVDKKTLGNYVNKAHDQLRQHSYQLGSRYAKDFGAAADHEDEYKRKENNRTQGIKTAVKKLTKEENLDELSKSTLGSYIKVAAQDIERSGRDQEHYGDQSDYDRGTKRQKGIAKAVDKLTKEGTMVTYKEFMASIEEGRIDDLKDKMAADREKRLNKMDYSKEKEAKKNPITKVKGHSYGAGDEDGEAEPVKAAEPAEKRGRGRPAGSKSGARA